MTRKPWGTQLRVIALIAYFTFSVYICPRLDGKADRETGRGENVYLQLQPPRDR